MAKSELRLVLDDRDGNQIAVWDLPALDSVKDLADQARLAVLEDYVYLKGFLDAVGEGESVSVPVAREP